MPHAFSIVFLLVVELAVSTAPAVTFTVTSTADSGLGTLRNAITLVNTTPGSDIIAFNISGSALHTITPLTELPAITESVTIDGYTQAGSSVNSLSDGDNAVLRIALNGNHLGAGALTVSNGDCVIRGLVINNFNGIGIRLLGPPGSRVTAEGNFIGTDATGTIAQPNGRGVSLETASSSLIGG